MGSTSRAAPASLDDGWRLAAGGWRLAFGGWRLQATGPARVPILVVAHASDPERDAASLASAHAEIGSAVARALG
jgi:hypothetical protein